MFAVVDIAGFQEKVSEGDQIRVPTLATDEGKSMTFDKVLLVAKSASDVSVGMPYVSGAAVEAKIVAHGKSDKVRVFKMKRRKRYRRTYGHRQGYTDIEITKIKATGAKAAAKPASEKKAEPKVDAPKKKAAEAEVAAK